MRTIEDCMRSEINPRDLAIAMMKTAHDLASEQPQGRLVDALAEGLELMIRSIEECLDPQFRWTLISRLARARME